MQTEGVPNVNMATALRTLGSGLTAAVDDTIEISTKSLPTFFYWQKASCYCRFRKLPKSFPAKFPSTKLPIREWFASHFNKLSTKLSDKHSIKRSTNHPTKHFGMLRTELPTEFSTKWSTKHPIKPPTKLFNKLPTKHRNELPTRHSDRRPAKLLYRSNHPICAKNL